jgi:phosphate transport system substrate-binding protein
MNTRMLMCRWMGRACLPLFLLFGLGVTASAQEVISLVGSGSNLPSPLYQVWVQNYNKRNSKIQVHYQGLGTGESIALITAGSGDFGGGEVPISDAQLRAAKVKIVHVPTVLAGIVPVYNVPGVDRQLRFSGEVMARILLGTTKSWDDPAIVRLNPGAKLPHLAITVVHRNEGKGSNYILSDFLSKTSPEWRARIGKTPSPKWPVGETAERGQDMVGKVKSIAGAFGYVELGFVLNDAAVHAGSVQNASGEFVSASPESITAACLAMEKTMPADLRVSLANAPGKSSYPIASFTWLYVPVSGLKAERASALADFLRWALSDGQGIAREHGYAPLPPSILSKSSALAGQIK